MKHEEITKQEHTTKPNARGDLFDIADEITAELVNLEQVRYLLDVISTDFQKIQAAALSDDCTYYKKRLPQFVELAKAQLTAIDESISASVEDIITIYNNK